MNKIIMAIMIAGLIPAAGFSQDREQAPAGTAPAPGIITGSSGTRGLGDLLWYLDAEGATGDIRLLGVCYNDNTDTLFLTGAADFTIAYLYEMDLNGKVLNAWPQPSANWGGWGWRDLCFDGTYIYAGDPNGGYIVQIDPATGQPTGVKYGPFPLVPCRALAYDPFTDSFWTASFSSSIYQCFKDATYNVFSGQGLAHYGAGMEEANPCHPMVWLWTQDGSTGARASEYDPETHSLTGRFFDATSPLGGGIAGGAGCRNHLGAWELVGMFQGAPDHLGSFDLGKHFTGDTCTIQASVGGTDGFLLNARPANGGRFYAIFGSVSGNSPGTPLPGGMTTLPINWDIFTSLLLAANLPGFLGVLDPDGLVSAKLPIPPFTAPGDVWMTFAVALQGPPWDFASNFVELHIVP